MAIDELKKLHTALVDTRGAYEIALKDTDDQQVADGCKEMISLRHSDHGQLHQALILAGETPDENGSFMSMVNETVVSVRAATTGISKKTLPAFTSGEEDILKLYDEAIAEAADNARLPRSEANANAQKMLSTCGASLGTKLHSTMFTFRRAIRWVQMKEEQTRLAAMAWSSSTGKKSKRFSIGSQLRPSRAVS